MEGLNLDQARDDAAITAAFETYQYLCTGELLAGEIKEDAYPGWTAEKIKTSLSQGMLIVFFCLIQKPCVGCSVCCFLMIYQHRF